MDKVKIAKELVRIVKELVFTEKNTDLERDLDTNKKYTYNGEKINMLGLSPLENRHPGGGGWHWSSGFLGFNVPDYRFLGYASNGAVVASS